MHRIERCAGGVSKLQCTDSWGAPPRHRVASRRHDQRAHRIGWLADGVTKERRDILFRIERRAGGVTEEPIKDTIGNADSASVGAVGVPRFEASLAGALHLRPPRKRARLAHARPSPNLGIRVPFHFARAVGTR